MAKILLKYLLKMCLVVIHEAQGKEKVFSEIHEAFLFFWVVGKQITFSLWLSNHTHDLCTSMN